MDRSVLRASVVAILLFALSTASAQDFTLTGMVLDQEEVPVSGALVWLYQYGAVECRVQSDGQESCDVIDGTFREANATSDDAGQFMLPVRVGQASLQVWREGYTSEWRELVVAGDQNIVIDVLKYPAKTARIEGQVMGAGSPLRSVSVSVQNPEYGIYECSFVEGEQPPVPRPIEEPGAPSIVGSASAELIASPVPDFFAGCAIEVQSDGRFAGDITPGYSIVRFYHESWRDEGPEYYSHVRVVDLPAGQTTRMDVDLPARPGPDATIEGYVLDAATGAPMPGVEIGFGNQDSYGWAVAKTDADGSFRAAVRSGLTQLYLYAEGYFPWEGEVRAAPGGVEFMEVRVAQGTARYGGCCILYAEQAGVAEGPSSSEQAIPSVTGGAASGFKDLGGGLGPYSAYTQGGKEEPAEESPAAFVLLMVAVLVAGVAWSRRED